MWSRFGELARAQGADVATVLAFSETLWRWADAVMDVVGAAHREVELEQAREEQQRRDAFVFALLTGTLDPGELRRESATFGLDPERDYIPFRARGRFKPDGMSIALDHDVAGISIEHPSAPDGVTIGFAAPVRLELLPAGFTQASRALQTALAFGQQGAFSLADLSIRPAILADEALGDAFAERHLAPIAGLGMELEETLRTYLDLGMRIDDTAKDAARARQHAPPPAAPLRAGDGRQLAGSARRRGTLVGTRAPAPPNLGHDVHTGYSVDRHRDGRADRRRERRGADVLAGGLATALARLRPAGRSR